MQGEQIRRVTLGTLANLLSQILNTGGQLVVVPVLLAAWGKQLYGEWLALSAAAAYLSVLDFGMQSYVVNRLNQCHALGEKEEYARILQSGIAFSLTVATVAAVLVGPALWLMPLDRWLNFTETTHTGAVAIALLIALQVLYAIPHGLLSGIYRTVNEYPRGQMINNARFLLSLVGMLTVVSLGAGPLAVAEVQLAALLVTCAFIVWDLSRRHPDIALGVRHSSMRLAFSFIAPSSSFLGIQLVMAFVIQGSTLLVGGLFGAAMLVTFSTSRTLTNLIKQVGATIQNAVWPEFTSMEAQRQMDALRRMHLLTAKIVMLFASCSAAYLMLYGDVLLAFWTRGHVAFDAPLMGAFLMLAGSQAMWLTSSILLSASNRQKTVFVSTLLAGAVGLMLGWGLSKSFGLSGFVFGLAAMDALFCGMVLPAAACRLIGESRWRYLIEVVLRSVVLFVIVLKTVQWMHNALPRFGGGPVVELLTGAVLVSAVSLAAGYLIALNRRDREQAHRLLARLLAR